MPCGGIITCRKPVEKIENQCWCCGKYGCMHFMIEWDAYIHARCAIEALSDSDSDVSIIIAHKHDINLDFSLESV